MKTVTTKSSTPDKRGERIADPRRVVIDAVRPSVDGGLFAVKRIVGERVDVEAHALADGHDVLSARLLYRHETEVDYHEAPLVLRHNDEWFGSFEVTQLGKYRFNVEAWIDPFQTWRRDLQKWVEARKDVPVTLQVGASIVAQVAERATGKDATELTAWVSRLRSRDAAAKPPLAEIDASLAPLVRRWDPRLNSVTLAEDLPIWVDPVRARASAWYELFPRSTAKTAGKHGSFASMRERIPYVKQLGFDVIYLPPIHPIGRTGRKGKNNAVRAERGDVGSPWAIGGPEGGHKAIHPELGTLKDFQALLKTAKENGIDLALDLAFQCSPDHPYVKEHPEWFKHRPDGSIQYAENPPKKYQDIYPFDFESEAADALWLELLSVVDYWIDQGVRIFRVDNPHTKPFPFWQWLIENVKARHPEVLFLAEAFTRPKIMYRLAKLGFSHSYTYFAWRNTRHELTEYTAELHEAPLRDYFRPHFWVNTPDILTEYLQTGGPAGTMIRFVLASTLSANYGVYGPVFELSETKPVASGKEEYRDSEKYQVHHWTLDPTAPIPKLVAAVNRIRRESPSLLEDDAVRFHHTENDQFFAFSRHSRDGKHAVLVIVNLDPHHKQAGWTRLDLAPLGLTEGTPFEVHDLLTDQRYQWSGARNYVELDPKTAVAHIFRVRARLPSERDYEAQG
jgi:starch synthase (maltosyl-transferring)